MSTKWIEDFYKIKIGYSYNRNNPCFYIVDSYLITDKNQIKEILERIHTTCKYRKLQALGYNRSIKSEYREWVAHNVLYNKLRLYPDHTKTVDFEQNESRWRRFVYLILSIF